MIGQSQIIEKYNNLQGLSLRRSEVRAFIKQAKSKNVHEVVNKLTGLLRQFPGEKGFEFNRVTPIVIQDDFEMLGVPYLSLEQEKEIGENNVNHVDGLGKRISNDDIYKMITNKFIKIIDETDRLPWDSGFNDTGDKKTFSFANLPINYQSSKYYRGINALVLSMYRYHTDETRGKISINSRGELEEGITEMITDNRLFWLTFKQIKEVGGKLKKGSLSQQAVYYNFIHLNDGVKISEKKYFQLKKQFGCKSDPTSEQCKKLQKTAFLKYYNVFNERDIEGVDFEAKRSKLKLKSKAVKTNEQKILAADLVLKHMPLKPRLEIKFIDKKAGESPYYSPSLDRVVMPQKTQFDNLATWYGVAFHEHIHATGHATRTDRRSIKGFERSVRWGDPFYALEELVAEIGSAFLNAESGILLDNLKNNAAYIKSWKKGVKNYLKKDNKAIFIAAGQSQKAADYILDFDKNGDPAYWSEYEKIQKEIKVKGKKQADKKAKTLSELIKDFNDSILEELSNFPEFGKVKKYKLGQKYSNDFPYKGMLEYALEVNEKTPKVTLQKLYNSFVDVNYHDQADILTEILGLIKMDKQPKKEVVKKKEAEHLSIITNETIKQLVSEFKFDKKSSFGEQLETILGGKLDFLNQKDIQIYAKAIKMFLEQEKYTKLNKKQSIVVYGTGILNIKTFPLSIVKPKKLNFREAAVMMQKEVASRDPLRPVMMHVLHEQNYLISTDAHALSKIKVKENEKKENVVYDLVGKKFTDIGVYPKYKAVIPSDNAFVKTFDLKELMQNLKGIVKAHDSVAYDGLHGVIVFNDTKIYFNPKIMLRSLTPLYKNGVEKVKLYVGTPSRAIIFKDVKDGNQLALCMPVMSGFTDKIIVSIFGDSNSKDKGLKGIVSNKKETGQMALFGLNGTAENKDTIAFNKEILKAKNNPNKINQFISLGKTKDILKKYIGNVNISITGATIKKAMSKDGDHIALWHNFINMPDHINNPVAIFKSKNKGYVILTETVNYKNKPLMIALHINSTFKISKIASVYSKTNKGIYKKWKNEGLAVYINKKCDWLNYTSAPIAVGSSQSHSKDTKKNNTNKKGLKGIVSNKKETGQMALFGLNGYVPENPTFESAMSFAEKNLIGKYIYHQDIGKKIHFRRSGIKKAINGKGKITRTRLQLVFIATDLVKKARLYTSKSDRKQRNHILKIHTLRTNTILDNKKFEVIIQLQENKNGVIYYDHTGIKLKKQLSVPVDKSEPLSRAKLLSVQKEHSKDTKKTNTNKKGLKGSVIEVKEPKIQTTNKLVKSINHVSNQNETFIINGDIGSFLGTIEKKPFGSVACTLDAPQGTGKTRFFFQIMNELAKNYKVLFISLEEHPQSTLFKEKVKQYIEPQNQNNIDTIGELERGKEKEILNNLIPNYDIVLIDSWNKIFEASKLDFDHDLRKAYNGKLIFAIFQRTVTGSMRGGAKAQFDGDIIMKINKGDSFKENIVYHDKNRYQSKDLTNLDYNIFNQSLDQPSKPVHTVIIQKTIQTPDPVLTWGNSTISI